MKEVIILRSCSNAGKSSFANLLTTLYPKAAVCCADDFFEKNGKYEFDVTQLGPAHYNCQNKFKFAVDNEKSLVIVANTNTSKKEWKFYQEYAEQNGYRVTFLVVEKRHNNYNHHNVPEEILQAQEKRIKDSLRLR